MSVLEIILICLSPSISLVVIAIYLYHRDKHTKKEEPKVDRASVAVERDRLLKELEGALLRENYEKASELRNRIQKLNGKLYEEK